MKGINSKFGIFIVFALVAVFLFAGFMNPVELSTGDVLKKFSSEAELQSFLDENTGYSGSGSDFLMRGASLDLTVQGGAETFNAVTKSTAVPMAAGESAEATSGSDDFSETNIQVEGVDEADIVKTDGKYIYSISQGKVFITDAYPAENAVIVSELEINGQPNEMYINGDRLVIFTSVYGGNYYPMVKGGIATTDANVGIAMDEVAVETKMIAPGEYMPSPGYSGPVSRIFVYDVSDASNPVIVNNLTIEGNYYNSRMIGDYVYAIAQKSVYNYGSPGIPRIMFGDSGEKMVAMPDIYYFDVPGNSYQFTSVVSFNVNNEIEEPNNKVYLMSYGQNIYVSQDNIYITYRKEVSQKKIMEDMITKVMIPNLPPDIALKISTIWNSDKEQYEKTQEMTEVFNEYLETLGPEQAAQLMENMQIKMQEYYTEISKELERSQVHKISISNGNIEYMAGGSFPGHVLNQFSMDEHNGYFRVATTTSGWIGGMRGETLNHMYVLDSGLNIVGKLEDLAKGERIYSARFMGDKAYMVTFRRVDPLFVIDLSNPLNPTVLGELKIPGYSDYLHPYDDNHIIGVGMDADESGRTQGLKLSLFDVSDVANPKEISKYIFGGRGSSSYALHDHKAFLFDKEKELLVIPASTNDWTESKDWRDVTRSDGAHVFTINLVDGFVHRGQITHAEEESKEGEEEYYWPRYDNSVRRSLYIGNVLYTLSDSKLKMNSLGDLTKVNEIIFGE
ncbi:MAG: beta-propeller domain-containing protein [Candidatus Peribacteraceae bacterium]|nr:beta-propeller domain-containing protein [Candidatus Peribacteraceae bacterium]